jgi:uncharacterized protein (DUF1015 family)
MAHAVPFRALRFDPRRADLAHTIAPPYDVISAAEQHALYERSPYNIVRVEYGEERDGDSERENRYTRAASDIAAWREAGVLLREADPAIYRYRQEFEWAGARHTREALFAAVRLEEWERSIIKPHEHTLANPKADRMNLLRATRTQVSPVYSLYRSKDTPHERLEWDYEGTVLADVEAGDQRHVLSAVTDPAGCAALTQWIERCDVYIADGHHRYETALAYRDELRARAPRWDASAPENFVLMALTYAYDAGLLVLPTHRLVHLDVDLRRALDAVTRWFDVETLPATGGAAEAPLQDAREPAFVAVGLEPGARQLLRLRDREAVEALMPEHQPEAWKRLDVNVLQYGVLQAAFGIDDAALTAGGAVTYTQDAAEAIAAVEAGRARAAFLLNATPVDQVLAVADAGGRMPQKSTYFYPKLPTGLVMNALD